MGSVLQNASVIQKRRFTSRQQEYLRSVKSDERRPHVQHELSIQKQARDWFVDNFPGEHLRSDTGSGAFGKFQKDEHNKQQSHKGEPDIMIFAARRGYHGLLIELKAECHCKVKNPHKDCATRMQSDGRKIRVYKDSRGRIIEHDYKIRKKGDWVNPHVERQARILEDYEKNRGYCARFAIGLETFKKWVCWYFDVPYIPPAENETLF